MKSQLLLPACILALMICAATWAQATGQVCVQAFEDVDGDGARSGSETALTGGVIAHLLNALGVTIDARLLENSVESARGLLCFDGLPAGDYTVVLTSALFTATAETSFSAIVVPGDAPVLHSYGVQAEATAEFSAPTGDGPFSDEQLRALEGIGIALAGALIVAAACFVVGLLVYLGVFRRRLRAIRSRPTPQPAALAPSPGPPSPASAYPGQLPVFNLPPPAGPAGLHQGSPKLFDEDDTNRLM